MITAHDIDESSHLPSWAIELAARALPQFLLERRWYPAKDSGRPEVTVDEWFAVPCPGAIGAAIVLWRVTPPTGETFLMFIPIVLVRNADTVPGDILAWVGGAENGRGATHALVEAFSNHEFVREFVRRHLDPVPGDATQPEEPPPQGAKWPRQLRARYTGRLTPSSPSEVRNWSVHTSHVEQSNTTIRVGERVVLKVFRRMVDGENPDLEVGRYLSEARFSAIGPLLGWTELTSPSDESAMTLAMLQEFVENQGDGWRWMLEQVRGALALETRRDALDVAKGWLRTLAERTAELHRAFDDPAAPAAFRPEPIGPDDLQGWTGAARSIAERALHAIAAASVEGRDAEIREAGAALVPRRAELMERLERSLNPSLAFKKTRLHGDLHLGQVLVVGGDAVFLDFEGEPLRPLTQRRAKHSVLRDVAGIVRSIWYVVEAALRELPKTFTAAERSSVRQLLVTWRNEACATFTDTYFGAANGLSSLPRGRAEAIRLLNFFVLEKALYEVVYELSNRPAWAAIALQGVLEVLDEPSCAPVRRFHEMPLGAQLIGNGGVRFRIWAPSHPNVSLELDGGATDLPMQPLEGGWHELVTQQARAGSHYRFVLSNGSRVPDPGSRYQPNDVHGPSEVIDPGAYLWRDGEWKGRPWEETVLYELHVGTFTPEGTFRAAIEKLDHLASLGVTAIELMPIADFPGRRNWGYDGVALYAPDASYGRPEDLKDLVVAAHERGLMVFLDVVYNHFGPEGAYIHTVAPQAFTERHKTPWGAAINLDPGEARPVREFLIHNALYWIEEFHLDGLRLDAVHSILDDSAPHLLEELAERLRSASRDRHLHLILENEENEARRLVRNADGSPRWYNAQWNDDVHHVLHVSATREASGYYGEYVGDWEKLGRALAEGFAFQGEVMHYRSRERGEPSAALPPTAFVAFLQNHDQIGNRAFGDRLMSIATNEAVHALIAVYLLLPQIPMLFMGEEWGARQPFPFFCDFEPLLAEAVRNGRRAEFARFPEFADPEIRERIPDPTAAATFNAAKLVWEELAHEPHASHREWYARLLAVRRNEIVPLLPRIRRGGSFQLRAEGGVTVRWSLGEGEVALVLDANLTSRSIDGFGTAAARRALWHEGAEPENGTFQPYTIRWSLENAERHP
jgi:glycogen operon protein